MIHLCTISDKNYLHKGLALYKSLCETVETSFKLHYLCLDDETFQAIGKYDFIGLIPYSLKQLESMHPELLKAKQNPPSKYGTQYSQYAWCLTPWFTNYILKNKVAPGQRLLYVDSDIYFYKSPQRIINAFNDKSVAIHTHRFGGALNEDTDVGWYNVGIVGFANNDVGNDVCDKWKAWLLDPTNQYYEKYGTCGDQRYLNLFIPLWGNENICVFDQQADILHAAPWCCSDIKDKEIDFFHFSHFNFDCQNNTWNDSIDGEWKPAAHDFVRPYYENYFSYIKYIDSFLKRPKINPQNTLKY